MGGAHKTMEVDRKREIMWLARHTQNLSFYNAKQTWRNPTAVSYEHRFLPSRQRIPHIQGCYGSAWHSVLACTHGAMGGGRIGFAIVQLHCQQQQKNYTAVSQTSIPWYIRCI